MRPPETGHAAARLEYQAFTAKRPAGLSRDLPPGYESLAWVANSATLIYGKRDAVLVDTFLTIEENVKLAGSLPGLARQRVQALAAEQSQDHLLLAPRAPARPLRLPAAAFHPTLMTPDIVTSAV
jgi:hypothetical protein